MNFNSDDIAIQVLKSNNWDINNATEYFYDNGYDKMASSNK